jgi:hypothetical protein
MDNLNNIFKVKRIESEEEKLKSSSKNGDQENSNPIKNISLIKKEENLISKKYFLNKKRFTTHYFDTNKTNKVKYKVKVKDKVKDKDKDRIKDNETNSSSKNNGRWTEEEHNIFMDNIIIHGNDWKKVD